MATQFSAELAANDNAAVAANDNAIPVGALPTELMAAELAMQNVTREIALEDDYAATGWRGLALLIAISIAAHAALFGGLGRGGHGGPLAKAHKRPPTEVTVTVAPPPPAPTPPEAKPATPGKKPAIPRPPVELRLQ